METVTLKDGTTYRVPTATADKMRQSIAQGHDRILYHTKLTGSFFLRIEDIKSIG